jgi:hypothetical protein
VSPLFAQPAGQDIIAATRGDTNSNSGGDYTPPPKRPEIADRTTRRR